MNNTVFQFNIPENEPVLQYAPGSSERTAIESALNEWSATVVEIPLIINGREVRSGNLFDVTAPHDHARVLARCHQAGPEHVQAALKAAVAARKEWFELSWVERASITLKAAELISEKYRFSLNAVTMLGQGKNVYQSEIDAVCETIDFLRYNAYFASRIYADQPRSGFTQLNRLEYRPLEGFVFAVTPFNFTSIDSNLNMSVALMGNTTVWKPASTAVLSNYILMRIFKEAGLPDGVINFVPGSGRDIAARVLDDPLLAGVHFTGSNATFNSIWRGVIDHMPIYRSYPRLVGETGGKDFIFAHVSANPQNVAAALIRGAFEYQGQKCSAASRAYIPDSLWPVVRKSLLDMVAEIRVGGVQDFKNFMNAVIDKEAFERITGYIDRARKNPDCKVIWGGDSDASTGWFIDPTIIETTDPKSETMCEEIFGPVLTIYVYPENDYIETLRLCDQTSPYALTGAVFADDRYAFVQACRELRYAAGNFYLNDKPTGAMVGLQPFGGARASGTNDKAGGAMNLMRWVSPRTIKETFVPASHFAYPFMG
ncbi:MAG: L-glutamate gamma-semialdehyde dehydrogenase [Acidobacteriota bacterium]|jgi:1-pyrroline-5-carboxylate dehydrogenase|nr:L-glutamate gamma-semialdehyde dehydrogenase [Acidobacteriota bacterium]